MDSLEVAVKVGEREVVRAAARSEAEAKRGCD